MVANRLPLAAPGLEGIFERIEVRRSARRKKTITAEVVRGALVVSPQRLSRAEEHEWVVTMAARMAERETRDRLNREEALMGRAARLGDTYLDGVRPSQISWGASTKTRWASCSPKQGVITLSPELAGFPSWVIEYVILHELAHLLVADHSPGFWKLLDRYPLTERARGFLIAKGMEEA